jgi:uncharacterized membrane protein
LEYLVLGLVAVGIYTGGLALGVIAFLRSQRYRKALVEQQARIDALEAALAGYGPLPVLPPGHQPAQLARPLTQLRQAPAAGHREALVHPEAHRSQPLEPIFPVPGAPPRRPMVPATPPEPAKPLDVTGWLTWGAGAGIAVAIIAFLNNAYNQGFFNQASQLLLGFVIAACLLGGSEVLRRRAKTHPPQDLQSRHTPKILTAAGLVCAYGITYVGFTRLALLPPPAAIGLMGALSLAAFALSLWHGRLTAWLGILGGFGAPALVGSADTPATALFAYLFAICAGAFALSRHKRWHGVGIAAGIAAIGWGVWWSYGWLSPSGVSATSGYLVAVIILGLAFAWDSASTAERIPLPRTAPMWIGAATITLAAAALTFLFIAARGFGAPAAMALICAAALLAAAAAMRPGFAGMPLIVGAFTIAALSLWPEIDTSGAARTYVTFTSGLGLAASVGGWIMMARNPAPGAGALVAAILPAAALFVAHTRLGGVIGQPLAWGLAALALAAFNAVALDRIAHAVGGAAKAPLATGAFALAAAACAVMAGYFALDQVRLAAGVAVLIISLGWLDKRLNLPPTRIAAMFVAAATVALLSPFALMNAPPIETTPVINTLAPTFIMAIASVWIGARLFATGPAGYLGRVTVTLRATLIILMACFVWAEIRHLLNNGVLAAPYTSLLEAGAHTCAMLGVALFAAWRFGAQDRPLLHWTERMAFGGALLHTAIAALAFLAPWWGTQPAAVQGPPLFNNLLVAYAIPGALFAAYAHLKSRRDAPVTAQVSGAAAIISTVAWAILALRHGFQGDAMARATASGFEQPAYSLILAAAAAVVLALSWRMKAPSLRYAAAVLAIIAFAKALVVDAQQIEGMVKYAVYALLAATAAGVFIGFQRYVFPRDPTDGEHATTGSSTDATLLPPRP